MSCVLPTQTTLRRRLNVSNLFIAQISRIEFIHTHSIVHRDIKPANFVMGKGKASYMVNVIDFGLAKKFRNAKTSTHIPYKQDEFHGVGTSLFAAIYTHLGVGSLFFLSRQLASYAFYFRIFTSR